MSSWDISDNGSEQALRVTGHRRGDGTLRIRVSGDLDVFHVPALRRRLAALLVVPAPCLELDLAEVGFCDAAGGRELLLLRLRGQEQDFPVVLVAVSAAVRLVLQLLGANDWMRGDNR
ncbi:STAS domain-containing protein [Actinoplanes sp. NPDC024001]|uniref:STAS domain-containing protein n=1 Tax=Actinoplanes sp. NPDC024001 TaxID=3154598 RepID=UPI0034110677